MAEYAQTDRILEVQGGVLIELDRGKTFRVDEDGLLHFRVRNLTEHVGRLTLRVRVSRVELLREEVAIDLQPNRVHDVRFPLSCSVPGEKLVETIDVQFVLGGRRHHLMLPDHSVTLYMAPEAGGRGAIDLSGVSFDFRDHVGDVVIRNVIAEQDRTTPPRKREDWCGLALVPRPAGHIVVQAPRRSGILDLAMVGPRTPRTGQQARVFLFARRELRFGCKGTKDGKDVPLVLRRMPGGRRQPDSTNAFLNELISAWHGSLSLKGSKFCLRDEGSLNGTLLNGKVLPQRTWAALPTNFHFQLTRESDVLDLAGRIIHAPEDREALTLRAPSSGVQPLPQEVGAEFAPLIEAVRLRRRLNVTEHLYVQVFSHAVVGSSDGCAIRFRAEGVMPRHAELVFYRGEWLLHTLSAEGVTLVDGRPVGADEYVTLAPGKSLVLGSLAFRLRRGSKELMTQL